MGAVVARLDGMRRMMAIENPTALHLGDDTGPTHL